MAIEKLPAGWKRQHNGEKGRQSKWTVAHEDGRTFSVQSEHDIHGVIATLSTPVAVAEPDASEGLDEDYDGTDEED